MSFKTEEEAKEKICIFRAMALILKPDSRMEGEDEYCIGSKCAQYAIGRHRCGLV